MLNAQESRSATGHRSDAGQGSYHEVSDEAQATKAGAIELGKEGAKQAKRKAEADDRARLERAGLIEPKKRKKRKHPEFDVSYPPPPIHCPYPAAPMSYPHYPPPPMHCPYPAAPMSYPHTRRRPCTTSTRWRPCPTRTTRRRP